MQAHKSTPTLVLTPRYQPDVPYSSRLAEAKKSGAKNGKTQVRSEGLYRAILKVILRITLGMLNRLLT
jgi:hypothetical protein